LKHLTRDICRSLNHHFLLPLHNPHLEVREQPTSWEITFQDRKYIFPRSDVLALPIDNSTAERIAEYICSELIYKLTAYDTTNIVTITIGVAETPTQIAYYRKLL
jgi:6-pyruvoyl-tetrahydropterin synthase